MTKPARDEMAAGVGTVRRLVFERDTIQVGEFGVARIRVSMEPGQCGRVPWFVVENEHGEVVSRWNAAHVHGVEYDRASLPHPSEGEDDALPF